MARARKILTKEKILEAQSRTKSNRAAARYLHVSFPHYKMYAKMYTDEETGENLFELHKNQSGRGIPKFLTNKGKTPDLREILEGRVPIEHFGIEKIKERIISEGLIEEKCHVCNMTERRTLDLRMPLILHFKDGNKKNIGLDNLDFLCYNCYFLYVGNVFTGKEITAMEDFQDNTSVKEPTWELDDYQLEHLRELGLWEEDTYTSGSEYIVTL